MLVVSVNESFDASSSKTYIFSPVLPKENLSLAIFSRYAGDLSRSSSLTNPCCRARS
jgi:hypothetical protein